MNINIYIKYSSYLFVLLTTPDENVCDIFLDVYVFLCYFKDPIAVINKIVHGSMNDNPVHAWHKCVPC